jgi:hypothetical protein
MEVTLARFKHGNDGAERGTAAVAVEERTRSSGPAPARREVLDRQREEFGGFSWGAAFFGWLSAVGVATLLIGIITATGAAVGLTSTSDATATVGIVGGILLLAALVIAYYCGGYVAGRMARFNGPRQGIGVWLIGLLVTIVLAVAGVIFGAEYNVLSSLSLPRIPVGEGSLTTGGLIALAAVLVGTLLAAIAGGKAGTHFHRKVDRVGLP